MRRRRHREVCVARPHGWRHQPAHEPSASFLPRASAPEPVGCRAPGTVVSGTRGPRTPAPWSPAWGRVSRPAGDGAGAREPNSAGERPLLGAQHLTVCEVRFCGSPGRGWGSEHGGLVEMRTKHLGSRWLVRSTESPGTGLRLLRGTCDLCSPGWRPGRGWGLVQGRGRDGALHSGELLTRVCAHALEMHEGPPRSLGGFTQRPLASTDGFSHSLVELLLCAWPHPGGQSLAISPPRLSPSGAASFLVVGPVLWGVEQYP